MYLFPCLRGERYAQQCMGVLKNSARSSGDTIAQTRLTQTSHVALLSMSNELPESRIQGDQGEGEASHRPAA